MGKDAPVHILVLEQELAPGSLSSGWALAVLPAAGLAGSTLPAGSAACSSVSLQAEILCDFCREGNAWRSSEGMKQPAGDLLPSVPAGCMARALLAARSPLPINTSATPGTSPAEHSYMQGAPRHTGRFVQVRSFQPELPCVLCAAERCIINLLIIHTAPDGRAEDQTGIAGSQRAPRLSLCQELLFSHRHVVTGHLHVTGQSLLKSQLADNKGSTKPHSPKPDWRPPSYSFCFFVLSLSKINISRQNLRARGSSGEWRRDGAEG